MVNKLIGKFYEKEIQKINQQEFRIEKVIKRKDDKLCVKWKGYDNSFNSWIDKKDLKIVIDKKVDLSNYATKTDIKNIAHIDTSSFALRTNLSSLKTEVDKLDIDKLVSVPVNLSKLSDVVKNDVVKKIVYDKLVAKLNSIATSGIVLKTKYDIDKSKLENEIPDTGSLFKKTDYNTQITEIEDKITNVSNLVTKTTLTTVENKIPSVSNLLKKQITTLNYKN